MQQMTASEILALTPTAASRLFPGSPKKTRKSLGRLIAAWHPDVCADPRAKEVFTHIVSLRDRLVSKPAASAPARERILVTRSGGRIRTLPWSITSVDQGEVMLGRESFATVFAAGLDDLAKIEAGMPARFRFADNRMKAQMAPSLTELIRSEELEDGRTLVVMRKAPGEVLLSDILKKNGAIEDRHVAWIGSGLLNIAAWLEYSGLSHGAIAPEHVLVDPATHSVRLAGGWCFAAETTVRPPALPGRTLDQVPRMAISGTCVDTALTLELIRQTLREALGDARGTNGGVRALPPALSSWLYLPPAKSAVADYAAWQRALETAWGPRRFIVWDLAPEVLYA